METHTLTSAITRSSITAYRIRFLNLNWDGAAIEIGYTDNIGSPLTYWYRGAEATALMIALNKANLSTKSLHRRVLEQLATDGVFGAGTISGTPD